MSNEDLFIDRNAEALMYIDDEPTPIVVNAVGTVEEIRYPHYDFCQIISDSPDAIHNYARRYSALNLPDLSAASLSIAREAVLSITRDIMQTRHLLGGVIAPGGSGANELAMHIASIQSGRDLVIASSLAHYSVHKSELERFHLETYSCPNELEALLEKYQNKVAILIVTAPDTNFGRVEDVPFNLLEQCKNLGVHIHVDAASALHIDPVSNLSTLYSQNELVDSMTVDPHKMVGEKNCGTLLLRTNDLMEPIYKRLPYYSASREVYFGTTQSPLGTVACALHFHALGKNGLQAMRNEANENTEHLATSLIENGFSVVNQDRSVPFVSIALPSLKKAKAVRKILDSHSFIVSLLNTGQVFGIRVVLTAKPHINKESTERLSTVLFQIRSEHPNLFI